MAIGDGIRRNIATVSQAERDRFRDAILQLDSTKLYPDGVSYWDKQDQIHQGAKVKLKSKIPVEARGSVGGLSGDGLSREWWKTMKMTPLARRAIAWLGIGVTIVCSLFPVVTRAQNGDAVAIGQVKIETKASATAGKLIFDLEIVGDEFGEEAQTIECGVIPPLTVSKCEWKTKSLIKAEFEAIESYRPRLVAIFFEGGGTASLALPAIHGVKVSPIPSEDAADFFLKISGSGLGRRARGDTSVEIFPKEGIEGAVTILPLTGSAKDDQTEVTAHFVASKNYEPQSVTVNVAGLPGASATYELGYVDTEADECEGEEDWCPYVDYFISIMDPKVVSDAFGKRIAKRFIAIQVVVQNKSKDHGFFIHDLSIDLEPAFHQDGEEDGEGYIQASRDLLLLRSVANKGRFWDTRNLVFRILQGAGRVAAGLVGVGSFGNSYGDGVAVFQGPVLGAYELIFPDDTVNQFNSLNDLAYGANTIVAKDQAKVLVVFVPQRIFLTKKQRATFWEQPTDLWKKVDLRKTSMLLNGSLMTKLEDVPPDPIDVQIARNEMEKFKSDSPEVRGIVIGRFLGGADIDLTEDTAEGIQVEKLGTATEKRIDFVLKSDAPVPSGTVLTFRITKGGDYKDIPLTTRSSFRKPVIDKVEIESGEEAKFVQNESEVLVVLKGKNLATGKPRFAEAVPGLEVGKIISSSDIAIVFKIKVNEAITPPKTLKLEVENVDGEKSSVSDYLVQ